MALSISNIKRVAMPAGKATAADITFDSSYPTGGMSLTAADLGLGSIHWLKAEQQGVASRICEYDYTNSKLKLYTALSTEAANASNQSTIVVRVFAVDGNIGPVT